MNDEEFGQLVSLGIKAIPPRFLKKIDNVAIVIAGFPTQEQLQKNHLEKEETLLGLYEGIPLTERGEYYGVGAVMPDRITIFKEPILTVANHERDKVAQIVRDTVWHEIAHYFGYNDDEIHERENRGTNHSS